jgi:hypothetical protein
MKNNRRQFLKSMSMAGLAGPLASLPWAQSAFAASGDKRAIFLYMPDGCIPELFHPTGTSSNFTLPSMTNPLNAVKSNCVFVSGLNMYEGGSTHEGGIRKVLTGNKDISLDYYLGQQLGQNNPFRSIHLGVGTNFQGGSDKSSVSFQEGGIPISFNDNPLNAFDRIFAGIGNTTTTVDAATRRKTSILDASLADLTRLENNLTGAELEKLQAHANSIREVEKRIAGTAGGSGASCSTSGWNSGGFTLPVNDPNYPQKHQDEANFETVSKLQMDLIVQSFKCDMTRVASLMWSHAVSPTHLLGISAGQHDASHYGTAGSTSASQFVQYQQFFMKQFLYLIQKLQSTTDGDGNTMLRNTLIFLFSELGDSNDHDHNNMPFILAGGAGGALTTGRWLNFTDDSHTKLLVSIANLMGVNINSFGYTGHGTGGLTGL